MPDLEIPKTADGHIDFKKWEADRPQREAQRAAEEKEVKAVVAVEPPKKVAPAEEPEEADEPKLPRSKIREINKLRDAAAEERGRRAQLEEMIAKGLMPGKPADIKEAKTDDPEPERKDFATDAEYQRAAGRWDARQEVKKSELTRSQREELERVQNEANAKAEEDKALFIDREEAQKAADAAELSLQFDPKTGEGPDKMLWGMLQRSMYRTGMVHFFSFNPDEFQELKEMSGNPGKQLEEFKMLEGWVRREYYKTATKKPEQKAEKPVEAKPKSSSAAEADAKLPKPSEAISPRGGAATDGAVSMLLSDGVTVNPAYMQDYEKKNRHRR